MYDFGRSKLVRGVKGYMEDLQIESLDLLHGMSVKELAERVKSYDRQNWIKELQGKSSLVVYGRYKYDIKQEEFYENTIESSLLFKARTNTLKLGWRASFEGKETDCKLCSGGKEETLEHFLMVCGRLMEVRREYKMLEKDIGVVLVFTGDI